MAAPRELRKELVAQLDEAYAAEWRSGFRCA
jgi:hypothetical protein